MYKVIAAMVNRDDKGRYLLTVLARCPCRTGCALCNGKGQESTFYEIDKSELVRLFNNTATVLHDVV